MGYMVGMQTLITLPLPYSIEANVVNKVSLKVDPTSLPGPSPRRFGPGEEIDLFVISVSDPTTGDTTDWTFGILGVIHSYCVELRPKSYSQGGFILPPDKIVPVGRETFAGLKALTRNM